MSNSPNCPECGKQLQRVQQGTNSMLNSYQFDAIKAGDWFCDNGHTNGRSEATYAYYWDKEVGIND